MALAMRTWRNKCEKRGADFSDLTDLGVESCVTEILVALEPHLEASRLQARREALADGVLIPRPLFKFLMGEDEIDGVSFGDLNKNLPGRFWWRSLLRVAEQMTTQSLRGES